VTFAHVGCGRVDEPVGTSLGRGGRSDQTPRRAGMLRRRYYFELTKSIRPSNGVSRRATVGTMPEIRQFPAIPARCAHTTTPPPAPVPQRRPRRSLV